MVVREFQRNGQRSAILKMLRWTLGSLDIDESLGALKLDRRSPAP